PAPAEAFSRRVVVERIRPDIDSGRFPIKRTVGESVDVSATIFADGHDVIVAVLRDRTTYNAEPAEHAEKDRSASSASSASIVGSWNETPMTLVAPGTDEWRASFGVDAIGWHEYEIVAWVDRFLTWRRDLCVKAAAQQDTDVELGVALLEGSMIVREAAARAEQIGSGGPDSTWLLERADRSSDSTADGGHTSVEPGLGTLDDFEAFRAAAERLGMEIALDLAWQCSPDHPWVREHPEWFRHRPDGTIKYAENPPKKYQDIYPLDFEN